MTPSPASCPKRLTQRVVALEPSSSSACWPTEMPNEAALSLSVRNFAAPRGKDLLGRLERFAAWTNERERWGVEPFSKSTDTAPRPECSIRDRSGQMSICGINFASQDYLSLSSHPAVKAAARVSIDEYGVHSAGSAALMGNTRLSLQLEHALAEFTGYQQCTVFPTGWAAGYGIIRALVTRRDYVLIDRLAHACLQEGATNATENVIRFAHLRNGEVRKHLQEIRSKNSEAGILIVTESLFSMDSDCAPLGELQDLAREHSATLLVDCAHDLGAMGRSGLGNIEAQGKAGKIDVLIGSFSKTFASNGGFIASNARALHWHIRYTCNPHTFSNAMSPIQCAVVLKALQIVKSKEGAERRERLWRNINYLREQLAGAGFPVLGAPSPIVPVLIGEMAYARILTREVLRRGGIVNLVEYPAVPVRSSRYRLQVMADHDLQHIDRLTAILLEARTATLALMERRDDPRAVPADLGLAPN
jgi:7-keto-8-aminopelargonate synthetase-like enzyme